MTRRYVRKIVANAPAQKPARHARPDLQHAQLWEDAGLLAGQRHAVKEYIP
jgi:hypothetical protein